MPPPPDDDLPPDLADEARRGDEQIRQMIQKKLASLSPEEGRRWLQCTLERMLRTEIVERDPPPLDSAKE